jgi:tetratricopeptide (TPR) repeat protein
MGKRKHAIEAHFQSGVRLHGTGRLQEAEQVYRQIIAANPGHADSFHMLGVIASQCGLPKAAVACIDRAIALQPSAALYHVNRASALLALGRLDDAVNGCQTALRLKRNCAEAYQVLGHALSDQGRPEEAVAAYREALRHKPDLPDLYNNLGLALRQADQPDAAAEALREAIRRAPADPQALGNLAGVLKELGRPSDSEAGYRRALRLQPDDAVLHVNLGVVLLLAGRFTEGWDEYEWRFRAGAAKLPPCDQPQWNGERLAGRTLLVRAEQGLGDTIQFCRHVPLVAADGRLIFEVQPGLRRLMSGLPGIAQLVTVGETLPRFDLHCPLLSLPRLLGNAGMEVPYLTAEPDRVTAWRDRLGTDGFRIGIAWQGNPTSAAERGRSVPLHHFMPLAQVLGVRLISLQKQHGLEQLRAAPAELRIETLGEDFDAGPDAFVDTAALMQSLDLVVTSDTSVAHLAGALGRPVWVALKHVPDWRWLLEGDGMAWYPTMRLFRQTERGDWHGVFTRIAERLAGMLGHSIKGTESALDDAAVRDEPRLHG